MNDQEIVDELTRDSHGVPWEAETQHTPGPWCISRDAVPEGHVQITVYAERDGERVATVFRTEANAPLIAAAPDLLEALEAVMADQNAAEHSFNCSSDVFPDTPCICGRPAARQAIDKAKGAD